MPLSPKSHDVALAAATLVTRLRERAPRVHCITNTVAQNFTANMLLAAGCVPSMTLSLEEIGGFVARADALLVNLGTFDAERREAAGVAIDTVAKAGKPWVLDPVFIDRSAPRADFARTLIARGPNVVRLNRAEFAALAADTSLEDYARAHKSVVALSGETDLVTDGVRVAKIANGHPLMGKVTAMGCAASALIAAALAVERDAPLAAAGALTLIGIAGEMAAEAARGPGSFAAAIVDAIYGLGAEAVVSRARVS